MSINKVVLYVCVLREGYYVITSKSPTPSVISLSYSFDGVRFYMSFILSLSWHVKCIIALCTVVVTYQSIYINQNVVIVNTNRNTKYLLFKSLFSVYCFVDH
jgi:hypothetical protein